MTKHNPPLTVEAALARIKGTLPNGIADMQIATKREKAGVIRAWGNPTRREKIPVEDAIALDLAFHAAGGQGFPMHEFYTLQLELQTATMFAEQHALIKTLSSVIKETGEAEIAILDAARPDATPREMREGMREIEEAIAALRAPLAILRRLYGQETGVSESMTP